MLRAVLSEPNGVLMVKHEVKSNLNHYKGLSIFKQHYGYGYLLISLVDNIHRGFIKQGALFFRGGDIRGSGFAF